MILFLTLKKKHNSAFISCFLCSGGTFGGVHGLSRDGAGLGEGTLGNAGHHEGKGIELRDSPGPRSHLPGHIDAFQL